MRNYAVDARPPRENARLKALPRVRPPSSVGAGRLSFKFIPQQRGRLLEDADT
jgi:hypothetical protein